MATIQGIECEFIFTHDNLASDGSKIQSYLTLNYSIGTYKITDVNGDPFDFSGFDPNDAIFLAQIIEEAAVFAEDKLISWVSQSSGVTDNLNDVIVADSQAVAVGADGRVLTSSDTNTWVSQTLGASTLLRSIAENGSLYVALGDGFLIYSSPDAVTWTPRTTEISGTFGFEVNYGDRFIALGRDGSNNGILFTSSNGTTWSQQSIPGVGILLGSAFGQNKYVLVGDSIWTTEDGTNPVEITSGVPSTTYHNCAFGKDMFVAVGDGGTIITSNTGTVWVERDSGTTEQLNDIEFTGESFIVVGLSGTILSSNDGITWTKEDSGTSENMSSVTSGFGKIAVGENGVIITKGVVV